MNVIRNLYRNHHSAKHFPALSLIAAAILYASSAFATEVNMGRIDWLAIIKELFGGLALFLFGMEQMSNALKMALGDQIKLLMGRLTKNRFTAVLTGAFITGIIQSSSVTTVLVVGIVAAGMMTMTQSVGVILGANVGSTITAQMVAFKIGESALWMIAIGFLVTFISSKDRIRHFGNMVMGLGLIFFGMSLMSDGMQPLHGFPPFLEIVGNMDNALLAAAVGTAFTALVQCSSAITVIVITMAGQGLIPLEAGIALIFGANIGTCFTALLASLGKSREALRAATVHVIFNVVGVIIWLPLISVLAGYVISFSPSNPELAGTARLAAEVPRQIANAHTVFNLVNIILFIGFTPQLARLIQWLIPDRLKEKEEVSIRSKHLNDALINSPTLALEGVHLEIARLGHIVAAMMSGLREAMLNRDIGKLEEVQGKDVEVDLLQGAILTYISDIRKQELSWTDDVKVTQAVKIADLFEHIGGIIQSDLVNLSHRAFAQDINVSKTMRQLLAKLGDQLSMALESAIQAVGELNQTAAQEVLTAKRSINNLLTRAEEIQAQAMAEEEWTLETMRIEMTLLENFKRVYRNLVEISNQILPDTTKGKINIL